jgi:hypothetical protein
MEAYTYFVQVGRVENKDVGLEEESDKRRREAQCAREIQLAFERWRCVCRPKIVISGNTNIVGFEVEAVE